MSKGKSLVGLTIPAQPGPVCLKCFAEDCEHTSGRPGNLTPRQYTILEASLDPRYWTAEDMASGLGLTKGTMKVYLSRLYDRLGWEGRGSTRQLALWAVAHASQLELTLPTPQDFEPVAPAKAA